MTKKQKRTLFRVIAAGAVFAAALLLPLEGTLRLAVYLAAYLLAGGAVLWKAARNLLHGKVFDENFLMSIATIGAFCLGEYPEGAAVMLFYEVGELFQSYAVSRSRNSIAALMDIRPDYANVERGGDFVRVDPGQVKTGEKILVKAGEKIPLDGEILEGESSIDTSALTGESLPKDVAPGEAVLGGCINLSGVLTIRVTKEFGESTVAKILNLVENAGTKKTRQENFITRFARYYTPVVVGAAALLAVLPPLFIPGAAFADWIERALIFLVISCPCALVISVPLSFFGGIGGASRAGILVKGSNYMEALADGEIVVFDKTGTLTKGSFSVTHVHAEGMEKEDLLRITAHAEYYSAHPISLSLKKAYGKELDKSLVSDVEELSGRGVKAIVEGRTVYAGNAKLMREIGAAFHQEEIAGTVAHVAVNGKYAGYIVIADEIKEDAKKAIGALKKLHVKKTVMLTGDAKAVGDGVAAELGLDEAWSELLPAGKVEKVEALLQQKTGKGKLIFAGDGINDAPVLSRADVGIAMGGLGSDAAIEAADVVIMDDKPAKIALAIRISRRTLRIVKQNIVFALGVKAIVLLLGALGMANMWEAVFADVGVSVIAILNAIRALRYKR